jgi:hypothetical protein
MAIKGLSIKEVVDYVSKNDPDKENPTKFKLGAIKKSALARLKDEAASMLVMNEDGSRSIKMNQRVLALKVIRYGLKGWDNLVDANNAQIPFKTVPEVLDGDLVNVISEESLDKLDLELIVELSSEILKNNSLTQEEEKN